MENSTEEDIEENLLRPAGVEMEAIDLILRVYSGEDLPQTDASFKTGLKIVDKLTRQEAKENCDPYVEVGFAGRKAHTSVQSNTYFPSWMEELTIPAFIPSMADRIRMRVMDSDMKLMVAADDTVGTHFFKLGEIAHISADEDLGFMPCFGPA